MNKLVKISALSLVIGFITFTGCQTQEKKVEQAKEEVKEAKEDLKEVIKDSKNDAQQTAFAEEWKAFKTETELNIRLNEERIAALKLQMKKTGKKMDAAYEKKIDALEARNKELQAKMNSYDNSKSNWETFKKEFNNDMSNLGKALKNFTVDNK